MQWCATNCAKLIIHSHKLRVQPFSVIFIAHGNNIIMVCWNEHLTYHTFSHSTFIFWAKTCFCAVLTLYIFAKSIGVFKFCTFVLSFVLHTYLNALCHGCNVLYHICLKSAPSACLLTTPLLSIHNAVQYTDCIALIVY